CVVVRGIEKCVEPVVGHCLENSGSQIIPCKHLAEMAEFVRRVSHALLQAFPTSWIDDVRVCEFTEGVYRGVGMLCQESVDCLFRFIGFAATCRINQTLEIWNVER